jgi:hypothetical protein
VRYTVERWGRLPAETSEQVRSGVRVSQNDAGYCDQLFLASIVRDGAAVSVLLLDSEGGSKPSREILLLVKQQIEHHLEKHA